MAKRKTSEVTEFIILLQSVFLISFGLAAYNASSVLKLGLVALTDVNSSAAFIVDDGLLTENEHINTESAVKIIDNFEFVCFITLIIGSIILACNLFRIYKKHNGK